MRNLLFIAAVIVFTTLAACNNDRSGKRNDQSETTIADNPTIVDDPETVAPTKPEVPALKTDYDFFAEKVAVKPMTTTDATMGEGEVPCTTLEYKFVFTDSLGIEKELQVMRSLVKKKPTINEGGWYEAQVEEFKYAKKAYEDILAVPEGKLLIKVRSGEIVSIEKLLDIKPKKVGNAEVIQDPTVEIWNRHNY